MEWTVSLTDCGCMPQLCQDAAGRGWLCQKDAHQLFESKELGVKNAMPRNVHHAVARRGSHKDTHCRNYQNGRFSHLIVCCHLDENIRIPVNT